MVNNRTTGLRIRAQTYSSAAITPTCLTACPDRSVRAIPATTPWIIPTPLPASPPISRPDEVTAGAAAGDIYISIENLRGSNSDDTLTGDGNNNVLEGGLGNDTLDGGSGGFDIASYEHATAGVTVSLATPGVAQTTGGTGTDTLTNIEGLLGSSFNDTLTGNGNSMLGGRAGR